jgi:hypothetical protein
MMQLLKLALGYEVVCWEHGFRMIVSNLGAEEAFSGIS